MTEIRPWTETKVVGTAQPRIDGYERVSGSAVYARDLVLPDMLYAAFTRCPHAHARVKRVDGNDIAAAGKFARPVHQLDFVIRRRFRRDARRPAEHAHIESPRAPGHPAGPWRP